MKLWLTKLSVVLITFMTLGIFIPPTYLDAEAADQEVIITSSNNNISETNNEEIGHVEAQTNLELDLHEQFLTYAVEQAKQQSIQKFGPKITNQIGDEFLNEIMPKIEEVIADLVENSDQKQVQTFEISEKPAHGYGEKIFHIYNAVTNEDVARFHVRRVNLPKIGHSFNFHYHLLNDHFEQHHHLGDIYWDKNTPPKWMS